MPLTNKGKKIMRAMKSQYGSEEGKKVFYASKNKGTIKGVEDETQMNWQDKIYESLTEGRMAHRGHRDVAGKKLSRPTPKKRTPEEAAAAAAKGQAAHDKRVAARKAHMKVQNKKNAEERAKRKAGQTLDPRTNKPK